MNFSKTILGGTLGLLLFSLSSCRSEAPQTGSQTNWLKVCEEQSDCADLDCICGVCTTACSESSACGDLTGATCVEKTEPGSIAACDGMPAESGMCLPSCSDQTCATGATCIAGACVGTLEPTTTAAIDPTTQYQSLIGFGAAVTNRDELIANHPDKEALYDAMFSESGITMIRFANRFEDDPQLDLSAMNEIISEAESRIGSQPLLFMTSESPPAALKANGERVCANADIDCTLTRDGLGGFDYAGFAEYWRASLETYETAGIHADYVSIQNNADFIPGDAPGIAACRLLGAEGTMSVTNPDGVTVDAEFAGYTEAMAAISSAVATLPTSYSFSGPEVGSVVMVNQYADSLEFADSVSFHLFLANPDQMLIDQLESLRDTAEAAGKPVIQSEMAASGLDTAVLTQMSLLHANAAAYIQQAFVNTDFAEDSHHLIGVDDTTFRKLPVYHAISHFARYTTQGWVRVDADVGSSEVLSSAWMSPEEDAITIILVNPTAEPENVELDVSGDASSLLDSAMVYRTVFDGVERSAELGSLSEDRVIRVPGKSIVTVTSVTE